MTRRQRPRAALRGAALLVLLAGGAALWSLVGSPEARPLPLATPRATPESPRPRPTPAPFLAEARGEPLAPRPNRAPRITSATLDRAHLCPGESTFLRVTAEDADDTDLRYRATYLSAALGAPRFGVGRWQRFRAPDRAGRYGLVAVVEDPAHARDEVPLEVIVDDCATPPAFDPAQLEIQHSELDALVHQFDLSLAQKQARDAGKALEVVRWHFGDGEEATGGLRVRHQYPAVTSRRYSYYLVQADVLVGGAPARIEYGLPFYSYAAANLAAGYVALAADVERGDDSAASIDYVVTFSNLTALSASAFELELVCLDAAGMPREKWREPLDLTVPGETSLEQSMTLDRQRCPGGATYELFGQAEGGNATGGLWAYKLRPTAAPTDPRAARDRARRVLSASATRESQE
jgi:hypothetical protein